MNGQRNMDTGQVRRGVRLSTGRGNANGRRTIAPLIVMALVLFGLAVPVLTINTTGHDTSIGHIHTDNPGELYHISDGAGFLKFRNTTGANITYAENHLIFYMPEAARVHNTSQVSLNFIIPASWVMTNLTDPDWSTEQINVGSGNMEVKVVDHNGTITQNWTTLNQFGPFYRSRLNFREYRNVTFHVYVRLVDVSLPEVSLYSVSKWGWDWVSGSPSGSYGTFAYGAGGSLMELYHETTPTIEWEGQDYLNVTRLEVYSYKSPAYFHKFDGVMNLVTDHTPIMNQTTTDGSLDLFEYNEWTSNNLTFQFNDSTHVKVRGNAKLNIKYGEPGNWTHLSVNIPINGSAMIKGLNLKPDKGEKVAWNLTFLYIPYASNEIFNYSLVVSTNPSQTFWSNISNSNYTYNVVLVNNDTKDFFNDGKVQILDSDGTILANGSTGNQSANFTATTKGGNLTIRAWGNLTVDGVRYEYVGETDVVVMGEDDQIVLMNRKAVEDEDEAANGDRDYLLWIIVVVVVILVVSIAALGRFKFGWW